MTTLSACRCEQCGRLANVIDSRERGSAVRRRRACRCGNRWSTVEVHLSRLEGLEAASRLLEKIVSIAKREAADGPEAQNDPS